LPKALIIRDNTKVRGNGVNGIRGYEGTWLPFFPIHTLNTIRLAVQKRLGLSVVLVPFGRGKLTTGAHIVYI
jgi:hypothetical protein